MVKIIDGDLLNLLISPCVVIAHQVNCKGVMGSGIAKKIREKWPKVYADYKMEHKSGKLVLGYLCGTWVKDEQVHGGNRYIANLCGQNRYRVLLPFPQTNYEALEKSLKSLVAQYGKYAPVGMPYGIGCGRAGGRWEIVYNIIEKVFTNCECHLYRLNAKNY
ncbi:Appr-1-p processing domain protein [Desulfofarcimen acetoxidans DSM 771]|uniref:Appr-1-p processing domain protein n=1 Tax=Desulfofarcimen acetoxidans (strain ATCC 49208 / DSM 771 / KCTC 5769 / VKM B-1644 / 5575) TaxID=485916 RepID=C8W0M8_DESAS|nr:macro domain-containing protein [Desulfofarcimen acetoxidans]ACV63283.1 Appr-1-p processing domain protein [Desulfofarcimen acetoxidans DSM 771]